MKKTFKILLTLGLAAAVLFAVMGLSGCSPRRHPSSDPAIGTELEIQIRQDFADLYGRPIRDVSIWRYYGTFNDASVVIMPVIAMHGMTWIETVAGIMFFTPCSVIPIRVWRAGEFYTLTEAYDNGWLTVDNLIIIANKNNEFWYGFGFDFR